MRAGKHLLTITLLLISPYIFPQEKNMNLDENISEKFYTQEVKGQIEIQIKNRDFFLGLSHGRMESLSQLMVGGSFLRLK